MGFPEPHRDLGRVKVGSEHTIEYTFTNDITVFQVDTSCGCAIVDQGTARVNIDKKIPISYKAKPVAKHLQQEGKTAYKTAQQITVHFHDLGSPGLDQIEILTFKAEVHI